MFQKRFRKIVMEVECNTESFIDERIVFFFKRCCKYITAFHSRVDTPDTLYRSPYSRVYLHG